MARTLTRIAKGSGPALAWLGVLTVLRLVVAGAAPLAPDEAYYWVFSRALAPGYLDHPPMVALWIRAGTLIAGDSAFGVRLLGPLSVALGSVLLADAAEHLLPGRRAGITASVLLNATLLIGAGSVLMTPDTPLLFFWVACVWALARLLHSGRAAWWLAVGAFAGLALASKYTAALLWVGIALWLCWVPSLRRWWRSGALWAGALLGAAVFLPVVVWNAQHGWVSFVRQGGRLADWQFARTAQFLAELVGGQIGLATPLLFVMFFAGAVLATRLAWRTREPAWSLLAALTLPGAAVFVQHAFGDRVQGNWPAILYPSVALTAAGLTGSLWQRWRGPAVGLGLVITAVVYVQATTFVLPLPPRLDPIARQLGGWDNLASAVATARHETGATFVTADQYGVTAELARAMAADVVVVGTDPRWGFTTLPRVPLAARIGILVRRARDDEIDHATWAEATSIADVPAASSDGATRFRLWRVVAGTIDAARLPAPDRTVPEPR